MKNNPQTPKIILFKSKETTVQSGGKQYLVITDHENQQHKISEKRKTLWDKFDNANVNDIFILIYESYQNIEYVADVQTIKEAMQPILERAIQDIALKLGDQQTEERNRSTALSYAKDMLVSDKIKQGQLFTQATDNYIFIKTGKTPDNEEADKQG